MDLKIFKISSPNYETKLQNMHSLKTVLKNGSLAFYLEGAVKEVWSFETPLFCRLMRRSCHNQSVEICVEPRNWLNCLFTFLFFAISKKE